MTKKKVTTTTTVTEEIIEDGVKKPMKVYVLIDNSTSMKPHIERTISSVNEYLDTLRKDSMESDIAVDVEVTFFSTALTSWSWSLSADTSRRNSASISLVRPMQPIATIHNLAKPDVVPNGSTPLLDAVGITLQKIMSLHRDGKTNVAFVTVTDGEENSSTEFDSAKIKSLSKEAQDSGFLLLYLGANQDAWQSASAMGYLSTTTADYTMRNMNDTFAVAAGSTMRYANAGGGARGLAASSFTSAERAKMKGEDTAKK